MCNVSYSLRKRPTGAMLTVQKLVSYPAWMPDTCGKDLSMSCEDHKSKEEDHDHVSPIHGGPSKSPYAHCPVTKWSASTWATSLKAQRIDCDPMDRSKKKKSTDLTVTVIKIIDPWEDGKRRPTKLDSDDFFSRHASGSHVLRSSIRTLTV